jgi:hypothetical protein
LHPADRRVDGACERFGQHRFAGARHVLDEQVTLGQHGDDRQPDGLRLAEHDLRDRGCDLPTHLLHHAKTDRSRDADPVVAR